MQTKADATIERLAELEREKFKLNAPTLYGVTIDPDNNTHLLALMAIMGNLITEKCEILDKLLKLHERKE